jgi:hypothetical protein
VGVLVSWCLSKIWRVPEPVKPEPAAGGKGSA